MSGLRLFQLLRRRGLIFVAAALVLIGAALLHATVFPDRPLLAFVLTFALSCATLIFLSRVRKGWRLEALSERPASG